MAHPNDRDYARAIRASAAKPGRGFIVLDTLDKLRAHHHRLIGHCALCARLYRPDAPGASPPCSFPVDLEALIAERGRDCAVVGLKPVPCPRCGSLKTTTQIAVPSKRDPRDGDV
jgi:hypothetical protein